MGPVLDSDRDVAGRAEGPAPVVRGRLAGRHQASVGTVLTIRDRVRKIQGELRDGALTPDLTRESLVQLTALLGNVHDEQRAAEHAFKVVLLECMQTYAKANRARIAAEVSPEYQRAREAHDTAELVVEMIRSCKAYLRSLDQEMQLAR